MIVLLIILSIVMAFVLCAAYFTYRIVFYNANKRPDDPHRVPKGPGYDIIEKEMHELIDSTLSIRYEPVTIVSRDGLKLYGRFYRTEGSKRVALLMHGWHGIAERDFSGGVQIHLSHNDSVLLVDERSHNKSEGHTITFGIKERYDCLDWINFIIEKCGSDTEIIIHGVSMGGATVLMTAGLKLPSNVKGVISDSGYTSPKEIISDVIKKKKMNPKYIYPFIKLGALLFGHFDPDSADALEAIASCSLPVMFIHGTGDNFVPCEMGERLYNAAAGVKFMAKIKDAPHVMGYMYDRERYLEVMDEFYNELSD